MHIFLSKHEEFQAAQEIATAYTQMERVKRPKKWHPPATPAVKVNWDATISSTNQKLRIGVVVRDHEGAFLAGLSASLVGSLHPIVAKF